MTQLANSALTETIVLAAPTVSGETDRQLLEQWVASRDVVALDAIVQRYAKLVYATCRRHSRSIQDAEDAVQATFLVLAAEAKRIRRRDALGAWLHTTAYRTAARIRAQTRAFELPADFAEPIDNVDQLAALCKRQHLRVLDEELAALSPQYRAPLVMHYLQECSVDEVAQRLSTTSGAVRGQLQRGRRELQSRLRQRGVELGAVLTLLANWQLESVRCPAAEFFRPLSDWIASAVQQPEVAAAIVSADPHPWPKVVSPPYRIGSLVMLSLSWFSLVARSYLGSCWGSACSITDRHNRRMRPSQKLRGSCRSQPHHARRTQLNRQSTILSALTLKSAEALLIPIKLQTGPQGLGSGSQ